MCVKTEVKTRKRIHLGTILLLIVFTIAHTLVVIPGARNEVFCAKSSSSPTIYSHGWPCVHFAKMDHGFYATNAGVTQKQFPPDGIFEDALFGDFGIYTESKLEANLYKQANEKLLVFPRLPDLSAWNPIATDKFGHYLSAVNWQYSGKQISTRWFWTGAAVNLLVWLLLSVAAYVFGEWLCRRSRKFSLRALFVGITAFLVILGLTVNRWNQGHKKAEFIRETNSFPFKHGKDANKAVDPFASSIYLDSSRDTASKSFLGELWLDRICNGDLDSVLGKSLDTVSAGNEESAKRIPFFAEIDSLTLRLNKLEPVGPVVELLDHKFLSTIKILDCALTSDSHRPVLEHLPSRNVDTLSLNLRFSADMSFLSRFKRMRFLNLMLTGKGRDIHGFPHLPYLQGLQLGWIDDAETIESLKGWIEGMDGLRSYQGPADLIGQLPSSVVVLDCYMPNDPALLEPIKHLSELKFLKVKCSAEAQSFDHLPSIPSLKRIHIFNQGNYNAELMDSLSRWLDRNPELQFCQIYVSGAGDPFTNSPEWRAFFVKHKDVTGR